MEILLDLVLILLLAATLFHAMRLERALGVLKRDRAALEELVAGFNASTSQAEIGIERLRVAADGAGRQIVRHLEEARALKDDLIFLTERGTQLADRMDRLVRAGRATAAEITPIRATEPAPMRVTESEADELPTPRSQAELDLLRALRMAR